ncbi:TPA: GntR family transcriptional regulator [Klebsiella oxytoca]|uniref:GntR family transcriptional regulator n=1 Tax=Klebsiella oxytoca TaxID=571 RepID=UPI0007CBF46A|nr:GntR family transcriptional regulator [Klebsiella oxytoca]SBL64326.1 GntR family transcriptional regulator [Klebsiella oxytoca]HBM3140272.1 GntR family transcriptional regulator [Klebsiella oxytoca]HDX8600996.1 GntR family transcriptional regulator [Klebsiella oxytoca]HDX8603331.1 GntR family transcriptional regulator [Klebsiella oxytoca]HDX8960624.1 GntR family transcriptional regulator [Klebsiella oxytoca]
MLKIQRKQTRDCIAQMIRYEIFSGSMKPGDKLTQENIAEKLGLSRMPVREALQSLEKEGFLVRLSTRHMMVSAIESEHIHTIFQVISDMATQLFSLIPVQVGRTLYEHACQLKSATDLKAELDFHYLITSCIASRYLAKIYEQFVDSYISYTILNLEINRGVQSELLCQICMDIINNKENLRKSIPGYFMALSAITERHVEKNCHV